MRSTFFITCFVLSAFTLAHSQLNFECCPELENLENELKNEGYVDIKYLFEKGFSLDLNVTIIDKSYTSIFSSHNIILNNLSENMIYSFTDALENYKLNSTNVGDYDVVVEIFDNDYTSIEPCLDLLKSPFVNVTDKKVSTTEHIVILNYDNQIKVYSKFIWDPILKEKLFLFNDTGLSNSFMHPKMQQTFEFCNGIFQENGYNIFEYELIPDASSMSMLEANPSWIGKRNIYFRMDGWNTANFLCTHIGFTEFINGTSLILETNKLGNPSCKWSCLVNFTGHDYENNPYSVGWTLAHETLHALTLKGARLLGIYNLTAKHHMEGGHFNYGPNLLIDGNLIDPQEEPSFDPNALDPYETIALEAKYLMHKMLFSSVQ